MPKEHAPEPAKTLDGLAAVVTGASSGIGRAVAIEFARQGAAVLLHARANRDGLARTASEAASLGAETHQIIANLSEPHACEHFVDRAWSWRPMDIWVHNAGADVLTGDAAELSFEEKLDLLWRTDVRGTISACRAVGRRMKERGAGVILTVGWDQAQVGMAGDSGEMFAAAKGAVAAFTRSLAKSLAPAVRVNCLAPGWIQTKWGETAPVYWRQRAERESLLARWGRPEDVAQAAAFLVSPRAAFINAQVLPVNGGFAGLAAEPREEPHD